MALNKTDQDELNRLRKEIESFREQEYRKATEVNRTKEEIKLLNEDQENKKSRAVGEIRKEAEVEHKNRMQSLDNVPEWVQSAKADTKEMRITGREKPELRLEGVPEGEGKGPLR